MFFFQLLLFKLTYIRIYEVVLIGVTLMHAFIDNLVVLLQGECLKSTDISCVETYFSYLMFFFNVKVQEIKYGPGKHGFVICVCEVFIKIVLSLLTICTSHLLLHIFYFTCPCKFKPENTFSKET